jgi:hypothetical protein
MHHQQRLGQAGTAHLPNPSVLCAFPMYCSHDREPRGKDHDAAGHCPQRVADLLAAREKAGHIAYETGRS